VITEERLLNWPPPDGEPIGIERARASVRWIAAHAPPLVEAAKQLIRERYPESELHVSSANVAHLATWSLLEGMTGLWVGYVWTRVQAGDWAACDIRIRRDSRLQMRPSRHIAGRKT
jgi:hypothetical protein